jgi:hypothetical protein
MSDGSDPPSGERPQSTSSHKRGSGLPHSIELANFDKAIILFLIAVFLVLFVWLLSKNIQPPTYAFWSFTALLTMIFVGFLRATGVFRTTWGALGGSVAVYVGLLLLTQKTFDHYYASGEEISKLRDQIISLQGQLKQAEPAKYTLQQCFGLLQQKNFKAAYDIISDARKEERKRAFPPGADDYSAYVSAFNDTEGYKNFTYELIREETENERRYRVTHDVQDRVPRNALFESGAKAISSFSGSMDRDAIFVMVVENIKEYYVVPDSVIPAIQEYVRTRTVEDLMDPTFIGKMTFDLRNAKNIELQQPPNSASYKYIWRYFRYENVVMIKQGSEWKIRSGLINPVIALYRER